MAKIITIDDDESIRRTIKRVLEKGGHTVHEAADASDGWLKVGGGGYDLVLLDIMLSGLTPHDFIQYLGGLTKLDPALAKTRILLVSAIPLPDVELQKILSSNLVVGYHQKPFENDKLTAKVDAALAIPSSSSAKNIVSSEYVLESGSTYLVKDVQSVFSIKLMLQEKERGRAAMYVTRANPLDVVPKYGLGGTRVVWLSFQKSEGAETVASLQEISILVSAFMGENDKTVILLEGLSYLITNYDFYPVLRMIEFLRDEISKSESILIIPLNPDTLDKKSMALLENECKSIF